MSDAPPSDEAMGLRAASQIVARPVAWLWPGRLALGKLAILDGDPGVGKSLLTLDLCARLTTGRPFPDGNLGPGPASAIVVNGEDAAADTIVPRLHALGADLHRVFPLDSGDFDAGRLALPAHLDVLANALVRTG